MPKRLRSLSGLDAGFLYLEDAGTPMHIASLMHLVPPKRRGYDFHRELLHHLAERLPKASALRRVLEPVPLNLGHPMWREVEQLDLDYHVLRRRLPRPGSEAQLARLIAQLHMEFFERERPLWKVVVIEGLASGEIACYFKAHHALIDGQGGAALVGALFDLEPRRAPRASRRKARPGAGPAPAVVARAALQASARQLLKLLRAVPPTIKVAAAAAQQPAAERMKQLRESIVIAPRTPFNGEVSKKRSFAALSLPLEDAKRVARGFGVSLNDVVMAICAAALREHLIGRDALPSRPLVALMPVSLRDAGDAEANNQVTMVQVQLPTDVDDPLERLRATNLVTGNIKRRVAAMRGLIPTDFPGLGAPLWASALARLSSLMRVADYAPPVGNLIVSNVPGAPVPLYIAGAQLRSNYPVSIVTLGMGLNITVQSYNGQLEFGVIACGEKLPRPALLTRGLSKALHELVKHIPA